MDIQTVDMQTGRLNRLADTQTKQTGGQTDDRRRDRQKETGRKRHKHGKIERQTDRWTNRRI